MFGVIGPFEGDPRYIVAKSAGLCCEAEIREVGNEWRGYIQGQENCRSVGDEPGVCFAAAMSFIRLMGLSPLLAKYLTKESKTGIELPRERIDDV